VVQAGETWGKGSITLIGDAAHPTTPALGQGGCMALEVGASRCTFCTF
jgi:2-polyprenyl-6-methoxyphenol hydroxylase-like FAD-dependent oxidoreductase